MSGNLQGAAQVCASNPVPLTRIIHAGLQAVGQGKAEKDIQHAMDEAALQELPNIENRVELAADKDEFGMPLGRIVHSYDEDAAAVWNANFEEGLKIAKASGAKEAWSGRGAMPTIHLMGGTIMGTRASNSVVNSYGQSHEIANLWIAGPGIFPTAGASNPTYTIFALSLRGAEQLAAKCSSIV